MSVKLFDMNRNEIFLRGVKWLEFVPEPVSVTRVSEKVYNGDIELGKSTNSRLINARFSYESDDFLDYKLLRNELYSIFNPLKKMWAVDDHVPGVEWLVDIETYQEERINGHLAEVAITFYSPKTYARSIGTSLDEFTYESGLWSYGLGLQEDASSQDYVHNTSNFTIYNPSNVEVDPREDELKITFTSISATSSDLKITNTTTGEEWRYQGPVLAGDTLTIDGVLSKRNGTNIVGATGPGFGLIALAEGNNNFTVTGITGSFEISFDFPFLYV